MRLRALLLSGIMVGLAVLLQTAPIWLGQPVGFALAILACLPMAVAAAADPGTAALALPAAALLCGLFQPEEGWIFGLTNGPFGVALGVAVRRGHSGWKGPLLPAITLFGGMALLTWGVGFPALGPNLTRLGLPAALIACGCFALVWSALCMPLARLLVRRTRPGLESWAGRGPSR
ncbi:hypothetical protein J2Z79_002807 [Symbiobacterium terraclitae]|uniref:Rod shape-determining protein MreD n=1 Tax=Symbiobacterium terraclitae TaxID=557451 RepID=A0ABS4JV28_9FIRM|nr:hypothetical protein [Symbiobacterium terraclitae]MBP2019368.1 hypothetical protein [Symbiobacterium terraclitae]